MRIILISLTLVLSLISSAHAARPSIEAYGKLPEKSMFVISPSGNFVAYRDTSKDRDVVVIIDMTKKALVTAVDVSSVKPRGIDFVSDNSLIMHVAQDAVLYGYLGKHRVTAAYTYNIKKKKFHQLLKPGTGIYSGQAQLNRIAGISADEKYAYMIAFQDQSVKSLFKANLENEAKPRLAQRGTSDTSNFFLNSQGEVIARERFSNSKNLHRLESLVDGKWKLVYEKETQIRRVSFHGVTPDGQSLVMRTTARGKGKGKGKGRKAYYTLSLVDGSISEPIFEREGKDVESLITAANRVVAGVRYSGFEPSYEFLEPELNERFTKLRESLPNNAVWLRSFTDDFQKLVLYTVGQKNSGRYLYYSDGKLSSLAAERPLIPDEQMNLVIEYQYKARDGLTIPTLLTIPDGRDIENLPAIMMPHGGPESYDRKGFHYRAQYFASQGYLVIQPQFRGSKGFGPKHMLAGRGEWGRKMQDDLTDSIVALANEGIINKDRVCIVGGSYGGYAALAGAVFTPDLYKCVVSINGVSDVHSMLSETKDDYGKDHWVIAYWDKVISKGKLGKDHLIDISPVNHVENITAPVLLVHGEYDKVVPQSQSRKMRKKMKSAKKDVTYLSLRKGDHYLSSAENRMDAMKAIGEFVKKHI